MSNRAKLILIAERNRINAKIREYEKQLMSVNRAIQLIEYDTTDISALLASVNDEDAIELDDLSLVLPAENGPRW